ncbi:3-hydroxyacyl-CoA dehydrogenase NAD-binding domain-containing protein [Burkholderia cepacia]|uniref:3-hydroxyacyl-CoA dehydrogenase NAD-binding domain-containing protein n=1 Tax=Burkholderia cepacia TaxID=292 RepID=UPI001CF379F2|nr:3-hydroxyacyl-CoA dehydrogenase NAD-binding domain-containing protein [Burkholderia cepacia]MCA8348457.1 enoyl-CoA hydratase/isomerase family protein [Burkholderia cepacia]
MFQGENISVLSLDEGLVELRFDRRDAAINKLDARTIDEFRQATASIAATSAVRGVLVTSAKDVFIVGADITEFSAMFRQPADAIATAVRTNDAHVTMFEDLPVPSVVAINGYALGGGLELALLGAFRVMASNARVGLPEVSLGLIPGLGGTARLSRVAGLAAAIDWVATGRSFDGHAAVAAGVVDEVVAPDVLRETAIAWLRRAAAGAIDWQAAQRRKKVRLPISAQEAADVVDRARATLGALHDRNRPAAAVAAETMARAAVCDLDEALDREADAFGRVARTQGAASLVQIFLNEQALKKQAKRTARAAGPVSRVAVIGAGTMGGGIACASALRGIAARMKDVAQARLDAGMDSARKQMEQQVQGGRLGLRQADACYASIMPQLDDTGLDDVDFAIETVVEQRDVKRGVLAELEQRVHAHAVLASNTSSLRIDELASALTRPEQFVGMHFFNPVATTKLVEVIRGSRTSDAAVTTAAGYAVALGKTPIIVRDCTGFVVNRMLVTCINAFLRLVADGADFETVDRVMEGFGWPMGPAYWLDVIGMDVLERIVTVIGAGYRDRMPPVDGSALALMVERQRYGQKSGDGFYRYEGAAASRPSRRSSPEAHALVATLRPNGPLDFTDDVIVERMMLPMIVEAAHVLDERIVATAAELDMALVLGLGFPAHAGGALKYADWLGLDRVVALCDRHAGLGAPYVATPNMRAMAAAGTRYYPA